VAIEPLESPADVPVQLNLLDALTTALQHRPELKRALLEIKKYRFLAREVEQQKPTAYEAVIVAV
jgi:hypothetical protein